MLSLTVNTPNPTYLSTPFLPNHHHHRHPPPPPSNPQNRPSKPLSISAIIIPPSSSTSHKQQSQLYQPYRPPPTLLPAKWRYLDTNQKLDILTDRLGQWFEYAPLITSLIQEGFISTTIEEITGIASIEQNRLVVATQVRDSLVEDTDPDTVAFFDNPAGPKILYELRILSAEQRAVAARYLIANGFDAKKTEELARSMKDYPRRYGDKWYQSFDGNLPGDCLAYMYFRQAQEHKTAFSPEQSITALEKALEMAETEKARQRVLRDLEAKDGDGKEEVNPDELVKVPVVRMAYGEVAESTVVAVFPVCSGDAGGEIEVGDAPWECRTRGSFGIVKAEKGWSRWVVLPGWGPVAGLKRGGVAVAFSKAGGVLPWKGKRRDANEEILVVADRGRKVVEYDEGFYLVSGGGKEGLKVERGDKLKGKGMVNTLGAVVLVVRPPRDDNDNTLSDVEWE
ncbi:hypothetical protein ABFX02_06G079800 [Erythranthe guttata]